MENEDCLNPFEQNQGCQKQISSSEFYAINNSKSEVNNLTIFWRCILVLISIGMIMAYFYSSSSVDSPNATLVTSEKDDFGLSPTLSPTIIPKKALLQYLEKNSFAALGDGLIHRSSTNSKKTTRLYTEKLRQHLPNVEFIDIGTRGDSSSAMLEHLRAKQFTPEHFGIVSILGGTVDLIEKPVVGRIVTTILTMHEYFHTKSIELHHPIFTVIMTIPQANLKKSNEVKRLEVNKKLREFAATCQTTTVFVDLEFIFNQTNPVNAKYWTNEKDHLSGIGYDGVGDLLFEALKSHSFSEEDFFAEKCDFQKSRRRLI